MFTNESKIIQLLFSKSSIFVNCFKERSYIAIRKKIILKWSFLVLNTISYLLMLMNTSQLHLFNWQGLGLMRVISISFVYTGLLVRAFPQSHNLSRTYRWKSSLLLAFCFLCVWLIKLKSSPHVSQQRPLFKSCLWQYLLIRKVSKMFLLVIND